MVTGLLTYNSLTNDLKIKRWRVKGVWASEN